MDRTWALGYIGVEVADPAALNAFVGSVLGLQPGQPTVDGASTWRMDGKAHRLLVHEGPADDARYLGFVAADAAGYTRAVARARDNGAQVTAGTPAEASARRVQELAYITAPWGTRVEIAWGLAEGDTPFSSELVPDGFLTDGLGLGHCLFLVPGTESDFAAANRFVEDTLGMLLTERVAMQIRDHPSAGTFYRCNPRHHSLALIHVPVGDVDRHLHHIMVETASEDAVRQAHARAAAAGAPIVRELSRHDADGIYSFYAASPAGFEFEVGAGAILVQGDRAGAG